MTLPTTPVPWVWLFLAKMDPGQRGANLRWTATATGSPSNCRPVRLYFVELRQGTLRDPYLHGVRDADGAFVAQTAGGDGRHWNLTFEPLTTGVYYIDIGGGEFTVGTYGVKVAADDFVADASTSGVVVFNGNGVGTADGKIQVSVDRDWFAVELQAGRSYHFLVGAGTLAIPHLHGLRTADGVFVAKVTGGLGDELTLRSSPGSITSTSAVPAGGQRAHTPYGSGRPWTSEAITPAMMSTRAAGCA